MRVQCPIAIQLPPCGVHVAQSAHEHGFAMEDESHDFYELYYLLDGAAEYYGPGEVKRSSENPGREGVALHPARQAGSQESGVKPPHSKTTMGIDSKPISLAAGDVVPIAPGRSHRIADLRPSTLLLLCLAPSFISANPERLALWRALEARGHAPIHTDASARERLEKYLRRILAEQSAPRPAAGLSIQSTADQFLVELARLPDLPFAPGASARVAGLLREIEQSFFEAWTLDKAAARTRLSRRRFSELFRQAAGDTFQRTLARLRVEHAARLMREGGQSIAAAAFASGFGDLSHFYRVFKEHHGHPPGRFLRTPSK